jgi:5-methylthioribose kinase
MTQKKAFLEQHPNAYFLTADDLNGLSAYLQERGWLASDEQLQRAEKAGEGNMNYTLRVSTRARSFILKQARPWVEKYPTIAAPSERALIEGHFYEVVQHDPALAALMPKLIGVDADSRIIALEDLGAARDFTTLYCGEELTVAHLTTLLQWLRALHRTPHAAAHKADFRNAAMRALNHQHIFDLPLQSNNGFDLDAITPGLAHEARALQSDERYVGIIRELGALYLQDGESQSVMLHGDYFPGSWLQTADGVRVIDPEFCFFGPPEFDVGVLLAHLHLAQQRDELIARVLPKYGASLNESLVWKFAGVEMMRRLIGVAQLPLACGLAEKARLLALSREWILA